MHTLLNVLKSGAVINFLLVILGSTVGLIFKKGIPEHIRSAIFTGMALCVLLIGVSGMLNEQNNILIIIISVALGAVIGELLDLDKCIHTLAQKIENAFNKNGGNTKIAEGFVSATLLFCVGAMTVVGSINSGISGDNLTLYSKGLIDCIAAIPLTASFGFGVMLASVSVLIIEGGISLLAVWVAPLLSGEIIANMTAVGSLLIVALSLNMLGITKIKVMNYLPAIFLPILFLSLF